jgi:hypothetical protein
VVQNRSVCLSANDLITVRTVMRHVMRVKTDLRRVVYRGVPAGDALARLPGDLASGRVLTAMQASLQ